MPHIGSVELALEYGGGLQFAAGGNLLLARDDDGLFTATRQRITRLIYTSPTLRDANGNPIGEPDNPFDPEWGAGLPSLVGENVTDDLATEITRRILSGLAGDPGLDPNATPVVTVAVAGVGQIAVTVAVVTASGAPFTFPTVIVSSIN